MIAMRRAHRRLPKMTDKNKTMKNAHQGWSNLAHVQIHTGTDQAPLKALRIAASSTSKIGSRPAWEDVKASTDPAAIQKRNRITPQAHAAKSQRGSVASKRKIAVSVSQNITTATTCGEVAAVRR
jgi:hypothetical protein